MQQNVILPNCRFFNTFDHENTPTGGVQCTDCRACKKCGFNPVVRSARLEKIRVKMQEGQASSSTLNNKQGDAKNG